MTVGIAIRVPGAGAVLACDSRISGDGGHIFTDLEEKWLVAGTATAVYAGCVGGMWHKLRDAPPRNWTDLRAAIECPDAASRGLDYELLVYDRTQDRILWTGQHGEATVVRTHAACGAGGAYAYGVLDAAKPPTTLDAAVALARRTIKIVCRRNMTCGGRIRILVVRGKRTPVEIR